MNIAENVHGYCTCMQLPVQQLRWKYNKNFFTEQNVFVALIFLITKILEFGRTQQISRFQQLSYLCTDETHIRR